MRIKITGKRAAFLVLWACLACLPRYSLAQGKPAYPSNPIRFIVPFAPGGIGDVFGRPLAAFLAERLGQPVVVDNRAGANSAIGIELAAKSVPDGHTLLLGSQSGLIMSAILRKKMPYDPVRDFTPVSMLFMTPFYLVVPASIPANSIRELVELAKSRPGKLSYGSIGIGSTAHLATALFASRMNIDIVHVPYKSGAQSTIDVVSGQIDILIGGALTLPHIQNGKLKALASTGLKRAGSLPNVPTMIEAGVPDFNATVWFGLFGPANLPRPIIDRLNREAHAMLAANTTRETFARTDVELTPSTPNELAERVRLDLPYWTKIMRDAGIEPE